MYKEIVGEKRSVCFESLQSLIELLNSVLPHVHRFSYSVLLFHPISSDTTSNLVTPPIPHIPHPAPTAHLCGFKILLNTQHPLSFSP